MTSRRSFFKRLAAAVAVVALAPEIAFKREVRPAREAALDLEQYMRQVYEVARARRSQEHIDIFCDQQTATMIRQAFARHYQNQHMEAL